ncbi:MAG: DUF5060 domain-containing protein [Bacteroidota bacterium]
MQNYKWPHTFVLVFILLFCLNSCREREGKNTYTLEGNFKKWQPITITFEGPQASETDSVNPFLEYSLITQFTNEKDTLTVHGYFVADAKAAHTGAAGGNQWRVKFAPPTDGRWAFKSRMLQGTEITVASKGTGKLLWETTGTFNVDPVDSLATGLYKTGRLVYDGGHYLREAETGRAFLKNGVGSPENFLAYHEFDGTFDNGGAGTPSLNQGLHEYPKHIKDWREGDPLWGNGKGKALIGALNYMASKGMNSLYFLVMNEHGDGDDVWPWIAPGEHTRFDISKLEQWETVFTHMDALGMAMNLFTQETENDTILNQGNLGLERKLFYKELVARYGHHLGVVWNLGEETNRTDTQLKRYAAYIRELDPYKHPIAVHNHIRVTGKRMEGRPLDPIKETLTPMLGYKDFEIPSLQMFDTTEVHQEVRKWRDLSAKTGRPWVVYLDEIGHWDIGVTTDTAANNNYNMVMKTSLWGTLMAGGAGTSWYFGGMDMPNNDMAAEDLRARDRWWEISDNARRFFQEHLPFWDMEGQDGLLGNPKAYCFAKKDEIYVVYLPKGETTDLALGDGHFTMAFYDPWKGGELHKMDEAWQSDTAHSVKLSEYKGQRDRDWVIVVSRK